MFVNPNLIYYDVSVFCSLPHLFVCLRMRMSSSQQYANVYVKSIFNKSVFTYPGSIAGVLFDSARRFRATLLWRLHLCAFLHIYIYENIYVLIYIHTCLFVHIYVCIYICIYTNIYLYINVYIYIYIHTYYNHVVVLDSLDTTQHCEIANMFID